MPVQMLPISSLRPHPHNPRKAFDPDYIAELSQSLQQHGQWDAIVVRPLTRGRYEIVAGHCRVEAAKAAGWSEIRADVREMSDEEADFMGLDTNLKRKGLTEMEEAEAIHRMITVHGWTQAKVAERFGKTQQWVSLRLRLVALAPEVQKAVTNRFVSPTAALHIAQAPAELQPAIAKKVAKADLSTRETEALVRVVADPATPADVRKAVLEKPKVSPAHAEAIAQASSAFLREGLLSAAAKGQITPDEAAKEVRAATLQEEAPPSIPAVQADRRITVFQPLRRAADALEEIEGSDIAALDRDDLGDLEPVLNGIGARLNKLGQWLAAAREKRHHKDGSKVLTMRGAR